MNIYNIQKMSQSQSEHSYYADFPIKLENCLLKCLQSTKKLISQEVIEQIQVKIQQISTSDTMVRAIQYFIFALISNIQNLKQSLHMFNLQLYSDIDKEDYQNLQGSVQKAQAQIRKHIRLQQQLKIYLDGLEEKVEQLEKQLKVETHKYLQLFQGMKAMDMQKRQLKKKLNQYQMKSKINLQKQPRHYLSHKASKILSQPSIGQNQINGLHGHQIYKMYNQKTRITKSKNFLQKSMNFNTKTHQSRQQSAQKSKQSKQVRQQKSNSLVQKQKQKQQNKKQKSQKKLDGQINISLAHSPRKRNQSDKAQLNQMTRTIQLKQSNYKKNSRKLIKYSTDQRLASMSKKADARSNSVCY